MKRLATVLILAISACGLLCVSHADAVIFDLTATLDGAQASAGAGTGSPGLGTATVTYDDNSGELSWDISWSGLLGTEAAMHFHGPALPNQNAGIQVDIGGNSGLVSPSIGSANITAGQATDLLNDLWYVNLHTSQFPGGEIRGQVLLVPEPAAIGMLLAALGGVLLLRRN